MKNVHLRRRFLIFYCYKINILIIFLVYTFLSELDEVQSESDDDEEDAASDYSDDFEDAASSPAPKGKGNTSTTTSTASAAGNGNGSSGSSTSGSYAKTTTTTTSYPTKTNTTNTITANAYTGATLAEVKAAQDEASRGIRERERVLNPLKESLAYSLLASQVQFFVNAIFVVSLCVHTAVYSLARRLST